MLDLVSLAGFDDRRPGQLNPRAAASALRIARNLAIEPGRVLLLDEPRVLTSTPSCRASTVSS